jgi:hypothetical protein
MIGCLALSAMACGVACGTQEDESRIENPPPRQATGAGGTETAIPLLPTWECPEGTDFGPPTVARLENPPVACDELVMVAERAGSRELLDCHESGGPICVCSLMSDRQGTYVVRVLLGDPLRELVRGEFVVGSTIEGCLSIMAATLRIADPDAGASDAGPALDASDASVGSAADAGHSGDAGAADDAGNSPLPDASSG